MKIIASFLVAATLLAGCTSTVDNNPHEDGAVAVPRESGPALCKDGTTPPCNTRD